MSVAWQRAIRAADALCVAGGALGGLWIRSRPGPARDRLLSRLAPLAPQKIGPATGDDALFGGADLIGSISAGRILRQEGILSRATALHLAMAERCPPALAARLAQSLDADGPAILLCDESAEPDEMPPASLCERVGMFVPLEGIGLSDLDAPAIQDLARARQIFPHVSVPEDLRDAVIAGAARLGISTLRAPLFALAAARASAALDGRDRVVAEDVSLAAALCLAHRAVPPPEDTADPPPPPDPGREDSAPGQRMAGDIIVDPARMALPPGLLTGLAVARQRADSVSGGAGQARQSTLRGRPLVSRPGRPDRGRIDAIATLRAAAPWQTVRRRLRPGDARRILIAPSDLHVRRYEERSERLVVFVVDASGSAAANRLADAKGAVETLLQRAYAARDRVALVAFRGDAAEVVLPPTRSLVMAKRRLTGLPGGGGTPLAAGLDAGLDLAIRARRAGSGATLVLLTDGRANIARDTTANRARAMADAEGVAARVRAERIPCLVVDCGTRPGAVLKDLAATLGAGYLALPRVGSDALNAAVSA